MAEFPSVFTTYRDVREANPSWTDRMVEDYLSSKRVGDDIQDQIDKINESLLAIAAELLEINSRLAAIETRLNAIEARLDAIETRLDYLEGSIIVTGVDVFVTGNVTVICESNLTVTLPFTPLDRDIVTVKRLGGLVVIDGQDKAIDGDTILNITRQGDAPKLQYSTQLGAWVII